MIYLTPKSNALASFNQRNKVNALQKSTMGRCRSLFEQKLSSILYYIEFFQTVNCFRPLSLSLGYYSR